MIKSFQSKAAQNIYDGAISRHARKIPLALHPKIRRLFDQINAATKIETLNVPPGNHLEKLKGNLKNYWSVRINKQRRIIFIWTNGDTHHLNIIDYH